MENTETKTTRQRTKKAGKVANVPNKERIDNFLMFDLKTWEPKTQINGESVYWKYIGIDPGYADGPYIAILEPTPEKNKLQVIDLSTGIDKSALKNNIGLFTAIGNRLSSELSSIPVGGLLLEDYAPSRSHKAHAMGELGFALRHVISHAYQESSCNIGTVGIGQWKKMLGLRGNCSKIDVQLWLSSRFNIQEPNNNKADSIALAIAAWTLDTGEVPAKGTRFDVTYL